MKKLFFILFMLPTMLLSQSKVITGNVTDDTGEGLPGVTIQIKNSPKNGALTDFDGNFKITISSEDEKILIFSYLGFKRQEINVTNALDGCCHVAPGPSESHIRLFHRSRRTTVPRRTGYLP